MSNTFDAKNVALQASKHLIRRYLDPKNIPKTPSEQVFGRLGLTNKRCCWGFPVPFLVTTGIWGKQRIWAVWCVPLTCARPHESRWLLLEERTEMFIARSNEVVNSKTLRIRLYVLRIRDFPEPILFWGWDWDHESYSREVSGVLGYSPCMLVLSPVNNVNELTIVTITSSRTP